MIHYVSPGHGRTTIGFSGNFHQPAHRLGDHIEAGFVRQRAGAPETGYARQDQPWIDAVQGIPVETHFLQCARHIIFDQHIGLAQQIPEYVLALVRPEVQGQAALVAVKDHGVERFAFNERCVTAAVLAAARRLNLDDIGSHVAQQHRAVRPGDIARYVQHADAIQRAGGGVFRRRQLRHSVPRKLRARCLCSWSNTIEYPKSITADHPLPVRSLKSGAPWRAYF